MSNIVEQINDGLTSLIATELGATYSELDFVFDITRNNLRNSVKRYGVMPAFAANSITITKNYSADHEFQVILVERYVNKDKTDSGQKAKLFEMYDSMDTILKKIYLSKVGLPAIVLSVGDFILEAPEFIEEDKVAVLRATLTVKYRQALS